MKTTKKTINKYFDIDYPSGDLSVSESFVGSLYDVYEKAFTSAIKFMKEENRIEVGEAQMLGFGHCRDNSTDLLGLIISMGLSKKEWARIKKDFSLSYFSESDKKEIDNHFKTTLTP